MTSGKAAHLFAITVLLSVTSAHAWKPITHNYLAEEALRDAQDGYVTIPVLVNGEVQSPAVTQEYRVDPSLLTALKQSTAQYRAGVMGPDAYPDIMTGQQVIHPESDKDTPDTHRGSNEWLEHLWDNSRNETPAVKAFVAGYLTHAAGDLFAHTFVNYYSGGPFVMNPVSNATRHLIFEGYIGKRTPILQKYNGGGSITSGSFNGSVFSPSNDFSIAGVETFIYDKMVNIVPGSPLAKLYEGRLSAASVPFIYSKTNEGLQGHVNWYYTEKARLRQKIKNCSWYDVFCLNKWNILYAAHTTAVWATKEYAVAWREDIDDGLRLWPQTSHQMAMQLIYPSADGDPANAGISPARKAEADRVGSDYFWNHMVSMTGAPDRAGPVARWALNFMGTIIPSWQWWTDTKAKMVDRMIRDATGKTAAEWGDIMSNPETSFDRVMNHSVTSGNFTGEAISLATMNADVLKLPLRPSGQPDYGYQEPSLRFSVDNLPAAYNTLIMSKLILLDQSELVRFAQQLPYTNSPVPAPTFAQIAVATQRNVVLGFIDTLDGGGQRKQSIIFSNCGAYNAVFKPQAGDDDKACVTTVPGDPNGFSAYDESSGNAMLEWNAVNNASFYTLERRTNNSSTFTQIARLNGVQYLDTRLRPGFSYVYRLKAGNAGGMSAGVTARVTMSPQEPCNTGVQDAAKTVPPTQSSSGPSAAPNIILPCQQ